jgi:hypothetical protein
MCTAVSPELQDKTDLSHHNASYYEAQHTYFQMPNLTPSKVSDHSKKLHDGIADSQFLFNPLKDKASVLYKDSVCTALRTLSTLVIKTSLLMFYNAKVAVCSEIHTKHINAMWAPCRIF